MLLAGRIDIVGHKRKRPDREYWQITRFSLPAQFPASREKSRVRMTMVVTPQQEAASPLSQPPELQSATPSRPIHAPFHPPIRVFLMKDILVSTDFCPKRIMLSKWPCSWPAAPEGASRCWRVLELPETTSFNTYGGPVRTMHFPSDFSAEAAGVVPAQTGAHAQEQDFQQRVLPPTR